MASEVPSRAQAGRLAWSELELAIQGYMFAVISSPSARAFSIRFRTSPMRPQFCRPAVFRW